MTRGSKSAQDGLSDSLDFLIRDTRLVLTKHLEKRLARLEIPLQIWFPLRVLYRHEGLTQRELGRKLGYGDARAGVIVGILLRRKLISRRKNSRDKRRIDLYLTPMGRKLARQVIRQSEMINARIVAGFAPSEVNTLKSLLRRAHENLS